MKKYQQVAQAFDGHYFFISILILVIFPCTKIYALENVRQLLGDYTSVFTLPKKSIEVSFKYLVINDTVDVLNFREDEIETISYGYRSIALNDMNGGNVLLNYGLLDKTTLQFGYTYRNLNYILRAMNLNSIRLSCKQALIPNNYKWMPGVSIDGGFQSNFAYDLIGGDESEINTLLGRFPSNSVIVKYDNKDVYFYQTADEYFVVPRSRNGVTKSAPQVSITDMNDQTWFLRLTAGKKVHFIVPSVFIEYGTTSTRTTINSTLTEYIPDLPDSYKVNFPNLPVKLSQKESYLKTGIGLSFKMPFKTTVIAEYDYVRFFRDNELDYIDYNSIIRLDIRYNLIKRFDIIVGGIVYHRQLNGVIPFLYNKYTQTTFDHTYGRANFGITYFFER